MDKFEYKVRSEEIKTLIAEGDYVQAAEIADTIDWRRVKSVMMLCMISDLYKINRRYEDAKNVLMLAHDRRQGGRTICYSLCELCIKTGDFVQALNYYKEFVQAAPKDSSRYILQYKLYEAQEVSLEERIAVLEELKKRDYREKWAYELAFLYHRVGLATRCVEECDDLVLWFGEGKYVVKAMELKMLHQPLTPEQQEIYDHRFDDYSQRETGQPEEEAQSESYEQEPDYGPPGDYGQEMIYEQADHYGQQVYEQTAAEEPAQGGQQKENAEAAPMPEPPEDMEIQVKTVDVGQYNTINLQAELAAGLQEVLGENETARAIVVPVPEEEEEQASGQRTETRQEPEDEEMESTEVFFGETGEIATAREETIPPQMTLTEDAEPETPLAEEETVLQEALEPAGETIAPQTEPVVDGTARTVMDQMRMESAGEKDAQSVQDLNVQPPKELADVLSQEADGQISIVLPEHVVVEKQLTGQMKIEDVLVEWERMKKENEEKCREEVRQHVLRQTGPMFTEFEASVRDGLLEKLESGAVLDETGINTGEGQPAERRKTEISETDTEAGDESGYPDEAGVLEEAEYTEDFEAIDEPAYDDSEEETEEPGDLEETGGSEEPEYSDSGDAAEWKEKSREASGAGNGMYIERDKAKIRGLTREEKELYAPFIQSRHSREQIIKAVDNISMAAYTGNVIITGEEGMDTISLAKNMIREVRMMDSNFSGKVAKISGEGLNQRNIEDTLEHLNNGALIVQDASGMSVETAALLHKALQQERLGIVVVLADTKKAIKHLLARNPELVNDFTARMDLETLSNDMLVSFGRRYAREMEHSIDDMGVLALHTRIEELQTIDHAVTVIEVKQIVDEAIRNASRKTMGHFFDILLAKRYDEEDMVILTEKDFVA